MAALDHLIDFAGGEVDGRDAMWIGDHQLFAIGRVGILMEIERRGGGYYVTDLGSSNGTKLNGKAVNDSVPLRNGDELDLGGSPYDHVRKLMPDAPETKVRGRTGAIGFSGKAGETPVKSLSGGEKARLLLGLATFFGPNMIILDEPTNHLDIDSRAALAEAINEFPGTVIMVSHDRYLIEACADQLWVVADQTVTTFDGDLDDYRRMVLSTRSVRAGSRERVGNGSDKASRNTTGNRVPLKQKISEAEAEIARINAIISKIDTALALPDLFKRDPKQAAQLAKARAGAESALQRAEEEWLSASSQYDKAAG